MLSYRKRSLFFLCLCNCFAIVSGIRTLNEMYWFSHKFVIWQHRQTNQILSMLKITFAHLLSLAMDFRALSKIHITFFACFFFFFSPLFIFPFIIVFVLNARAYRSHIRNKPSKIADSITLFVSCTLALHSIINAPIFDQTSILAYFFYILVLLSRFSTCRRNCDTVGFLLLQMSLFVQYIYFPLVCQYWHRWLIICCFPLVIAFYC